jgi:hypothetical protein
VKVAFVVNVCQSAVNPFSRTVQSSSLVSAHWGTANSTPALPPTLDFKEFIHI